MVNKRWKDPSEKEEREEPGNGGRNVGVHFGCDAGLATIPFGPSGPKLQSARTWAGVGAHVVGPKDGPFFAR